MRTYYTRNPQKKQQLFILFPREISQKQEKAGNNYYLKNKNRKQPLCCAHWRSGEAAANC